MTLQRVTVAFTFVVVLAGVAVFAAAYRPVTDSNRATVTFVDENDTTLGEVHATIADTPQERYTGLSDTEALANDSGMLFVYHGEGNRTFVMRRMAFPLDMVFIGANGSVTAIHHAPLEADQSSLTNYRGSAQWILEVNYNWTTAHDVSVGDRVTIGYPPNASVTPTPISG